MDNTEQLLDPLSKEALAVKPAPHPFRLCLLWMGGGTVYLAATLAFTGLRADWLESLHNPLFAAELIMLLGLFIVTALSASLLASPDLHQKQRIVYAPLGQALILVGVLLLAWHADSPAAPQPVHSIESTAGILLTMLLPAVWTFFSMRKFTSTHSRVAGSVALLSAFSVGALWLRLHETNNSVSHVVEWHYLPAFGIGVLGLWLGKKLLKW